ncbi:hypothetical protein [Sphingomonas sp. 1185]|uniref:hypothetical protein n=1 Tax=Sphingomonas sp. 1185 TaxID=3156411 RepID=UPI0033981D26
MSRDRSATATSLPPLAHNGRLAQLAAERFPVTVAPMSKGKRAEYWLGEYVNARRELPHLRPSELLALIAEEDEAACGATFTRTIKRLAQPHLGDNTRSTPSPTRAPRRKVPAPVPSVTSPHLLGNIETTAPSPSRSDDNDNVTEADLFARMQGLRATPPVRHEA